MVTHSCFVQANMLFHSYLFLYQEESFHYRFSTFYYVTSYYQTSKKIFVFGSTWIYSLHNPYRLDI